MRNIAFYGFAAAAPNGAVLVRLTNQHLLEGSVFRLPHRGEGRGEIRIHGDLPVVTAATFAERNLFKVINLDLAPTQSVTGSAASDTLTTPAAHGYNVGDLIEFTALTGGTGLAVGPPSGPVYYVQAVPTSSTFKVAASRGGAVIDFTSDVSAGTVRHLVSIDDSHLACPGAFLLDDGDFEVVSRNEQAGRILKFGGPGALYILERARLLEDVYAPGQPARGDNNDVPGMWNWIEEPWGAMLTRFIEEGQNQPGTPLADVTIDFTRTVDSAGTLWPDVDTSWQTPIRTGGSQMYPRFVEAGLILRMGGNLDLKAYGPTTAFGVDRTSATFAAGKVRFEAGVNIADSLSRSIRPKVDASHVIVEGKDQVYEMVAWNDAEANLSPAPAVMRWVDLTVPETDDVPTLRRLGGEELKARRRKSDSFRFPHPPGDDELAGLYTPFKHYKPGDVTTAHTGTGARDANELSIEVAAVSLVLSDDAGNWLPVPELGASYLSPSAALEQSRIETVVAEAIGAHTHPIPYCTPSAFAAEIVDSQDPDPPSGVTSIEFGYEKLDLTLVTIWDSLVGPEPSTIRVGSQVRRWFVRVHRSSAPTEVVYYSDDPVHCNAVDAGGTLTLNWEWSVDFVGSSDFDDTVVEVTVLPGAGLPELVGTPPGVATCSHKHHVIRERAPTASDDVANGYPLLTHWTQVDDVLAPTEILGTWLHVADGVWLPVGAAAGEAPVDHGSMGATETLDVGDGTWHIGTLDADLTLTVQGFTVDVGKVVLFRVTQDGTGGHGITQDPQVVFQGADQPAQGANAVTWYAYWTDQGDSIVYGAVIGSSAAALIVREVGGSDIDPVAELEFDADDFAVTDQGSGVARVALAAGAGGGDPADDTHVWMPLTTVVGGAPELVWDDDDSLIPTLTPL